jgi:hypothetical protein
LAITIAKISNALVLAAVGTLYVLAVEALAVAVDAFYARRSVDRAALLLGLCEQVSAPA